MDKSVISSWEDEPARHTCPHVSGSSQRGPGYEATFIELYSDLTVSLGQNIKHLSLSLSESEKKGSAGLKIVICLSEE